MYIYEVGARGRPRLNGDVVLHVATTAVVVNTLCIPVEHGGKLMHLYM